MADKKKRRTKSAGHNRKRKIALEEPTHEEPTSEQAESDLSADAAGDFATGSMQIGEDNEKKSVTDKTGDNEEPNAGDREQIARDLSSRKPSSKEVLSRLLEKNEVIVKLENENAEKDKQLKELNDKWLRLAAEFENYRKRSRKEWELLKMQSKTEVILEILSIVDDFERAFSAAEDTGSDDFVQGIRLIYNNLISVLSKFGIREIDAHQSSFDPNFHMAVGQIETDETKSGHVVEVIQKGYQLDETVIRPARVIVAK